MPADKTTTTHVFGLYGAGGFAREIMPLLRDQIEAESQHGGTALRQSCFVDRSPHEATLNGYPLISEEAFFAQECGARFFNIAIADSKLRERIATECLAKGAKALTITSRHAIIYDHNDIAEGAILCAHTTITSNTKIGRFFHANIYSYVAHDCIIGDYVTFAPNVHCNGSVHIHDHAYIGTGAILKQGTASKPLVIGEGAIVGMGAVVTKDVAPYTTVIGNPARPYCASPK